MAKSYPFWRKYRIEFFVDNENKEFRVTRDEYKLLEEGDSGILTFQGIYYISFEKNINIE